MGTITDFDAQRESPVFVLDVHSGSLWAKMRGKIGVTCGGALKLLYSTTAMPDINIAMACAQGRGWFSATQATTL